MPTRELLFCFFKVISFAILHEILRHHTFPTGVKKIETTPSLSLNNNNNIDGDNIVTVRSVIELNARSIFFIFVDI